MGENSFRKCFSVNAGVWLRMENTFFGNAFQFDCVLGVKSFPFLFYLQISFFGKQRERERERESPSPATTSLRLRRRPRAFAPWTHEPIFDFAGKPRAQITHEARAFDPRAFNFAGNSEPLTSPETHEPISLFVRFWFLCDFDFCCCCGGVLVVFVVVGFVWVVMENNIFKMLPNTWKYFLEQFS